MSGSMDDITDLNAFLANMQTQNGKYVEELLLLSAADDVFSSCAGSRRCGPDEEAGESPQRAAYASAPVGGSAAEAEANISSGSGASGMDSLMELAMQANREQSSVDSDPFLVKMMQQMEGASSSSTSLGVPAPGSEGIVAESGGTKNASETLPFVAYQKVDEVFFTGSRVGAITLEGGRAFEVCERKEVGERVVVLLRSSGEPLQSLFLDCSARHIMGAVCARSNEKAVEQLIVGLCDYLEDMGI